MKYDVFVAHVTLFLFVFMYVCVYAYVRSCVYVEQSGYHNDAMSVTKHGEDSECSYYYNSAEWGCVHQGDAMISKWKDPEKEDKHELETVSILKGEGGKFYFYVEHFFSKKEKYYLKDYKMAGEMVLWINGKVKGSYSHGVNVDTHTNNGSINPSYQDHFYVTVDCDMDCKCSAVKTIDKVCEVKATLKFPDVETAPYTGKILSII